MTQAIEELMDRIKNVQFRMSCECPGMIPYTYGKDTVQDANRNALYSWAYHEHMKLTNELVQLLNKHKPDKKKTFIWMTISFRKEKTLEEISNVLDKLSRRSFMTQYHYNIEQRSEDVDNIHGIHSHWIVQTNHPLGQFKRDVMSTLKYKGDPDDLESFVGNQKHIDIRQYTCDLMDDKLAYLRGDKWDDMKNVKAIVDKQWREKNNISQLYTNALSS